MLQSLARDFAAKEIIPRAEHYDLSGEWPRDIFRQGREIGLVNLNIPEEYGGHGRVGAGGVHRRRGICLRLFRHPDGADPQPIGGVADPAGRQR